jgi:hypothetical protein
LFSISSHVHDVLGVVLGVDDVWGGERVGFDWIENEIKDEVHSKRQSYERMSRHNCRYSRNQLSCREQEQERAQNREQHRRRDRRGDRRAEGREGKVREREGIKEKWTCHYSRHWCCHHHVLLLLLLSILEKLQRQREREKRTSGVHW